MRKETSENTHFKRPVLNNHVLQAIDFIYMSQQEFPDSAEYNP